MPADPFRRAPMVDFDHPVGESLFWRISAAMERLVEQLENYSPADLFFQKVDRDIAEAEEAERDLANQATQRHNEQPPPSDKRPDLDDLRRGRWYDERPITTAPTTSAAGGSMASIEEVRAGIMAANEKANEGLGAVQQGHASLEQAQATFMQASEGSGQADASEANGLFAQAVATLEDARQQAAAAISAAEGFGNRL